jgi:hypothetical protein
VNTHTNNSVEGLPADEAADRFAFALGGLPWFVDASESLLVLGLLDLVPFAYLLGLLLVLAARLGVACSPFGAALKPCRYPASLLTSATDVLGFLAIKSSRMSAKYKK